MFGARFKRDLQLVNLWKKIFQDEYFGEQILRLTEISTETERLTEISAGLMNHIRKFVVKKRTMWLLISSQNISGENFLKK